MIITSKDEVSFERIRNGYVVIALHSNSSYRAPLTDYDDIMRQWKDDKSMLEFTDIWGNEIIYKKECIEGISKMTAEYAQMDEAETREMALKE